MSRRHCRCLNARSSPSTSLTSIAGRSVRLPAKKSDMVVGLRPLARANSPCVTPPSSSIASRRRSGDMPAGASRTGAYGSASGAPTAKPRRYRGVPSDGDEAGVGPRRRGLWDTGAGERKAGGPHGGKQRVAFDRGAWIGVPYPPPAAGKRSEMGYRCRGAG